MANTLRIKRRATGLAGAPAGLVNAELAYNEVDDILYYGRGVSTGITAATVVAIGGQGLFSNYVSLTGPQTISGNKIFSGTVDVPTVPAANNGTSAASTAWVRGFAQPVAASLTALSVLATFGAVYQVSANTYATRVLTGTAGRVAVSNGDGIAGNPTLDLIATGITAGTYAKLTVDIYGRATVGSTLASSDIITALGYTPENVANKGVVNGYASLDGTGKVPVGQLPASVTGGLNYQGTWNASTNTPTLVNGTGVKGYYYKVSVPGNTTIDGNSNWTAGDMIIFDGLTWDKAEGGSPDVISVAGRVGAITLTTSDITGLGTLAIQNANAVNITGGIIATSTLSGTVSVPNGGTGAATLTGYVKGNGTAAMTAFATIPNTDINGLGTLSTQNASAVNITGGTIAASTITGNITGNAANVTGTVAVANGGTGTGTLTGYVKGTGTTALAAFATIPNTDITGLGTMSVQNASAVAITGGTVDGITLDGGTF